MEKPTMMHELCITKVFTVTNTLYLVGTADSLSGLEEFGRMEREGEVAQRYILSVDPRYDLAEVVAYILRSRNAFLGEWALVIGGTSFSKKVQSLLLEASKG